MNFRHPDTLWVSYIDFLTKIFFMIKWTPKKTPKKYF